MKRTIIIVGLMTWLAACGGNTSQGVNETDEGNGPTLDVSTPAGKTKAEAIIKMVLQEVNKVFNNLKLPGINASEELSKICTENNYSISLDTSVAGKTGGEANISATASTNKVADDKLGITVDYTGIFDDYGFNTIAITGNVDMNVAAAIQKGFKEVCAGNDDPIIAGDGLQHAYGTLSISGSVGAAVAFDTTTSLNFSPEEDTVINMQGDISFKSGGDILECPMNFSGTIEQLIENSQMYEINCEQA